MVLQMAPPPLFGALVAILTPHLGQPINEVMYIVAYLGEAEVMQTWKGVWSATEKSLKDPVKVTRAQI